MVTSLLECSTILITGATSGLGRGMAVRLLKEHPNVKLIITGRREQNLQEFVTEYGSSRVAAIPFDLAKVENISELAEKALACFNGSLDGVILNAGMQRVFKFTARDAAKSIDMQALRMELDVNYTSQVALTQHLLPHLIEVAKAGKPASINFVTSSLSLVPIKTCLNYCATKAALHSFILCIRGQVDELNLDGKLGVTEIVPPLVDSELHDSKHQPELAFDIRGHPPNSMSLGDYLDGVWEGWSMKGGPPDEITVGTSTKSSWETVDKPRKEIIARIWRNF
ncbi:unnamed protein product [Calypogeia fissa]